MKTTMVTRLKPGFIHVRRGMTIIPRVDDYEVVARLETYGWFPMIEAVPMEQRVKLQVWRDKAAGVKRRK